VSNVRRFAAINTKIRVLKSRLLSAKDYTSLIELNNTEDQIKFLRNNTYYKEILKDSKELQIQTIEIELKKFLIHQYKKITKYFTDDYARFFRTLLLRFEIEDLKQIIKSVSRSKPIPYSTLYFKDEYYNLDIEELSKVKNLSELVQELEGTIYYETLKKYENETSKVIFYMEMGLDRLYFDELFIQSNKLSKEDRMIFQEFLGINIDLLNSEWIYRGIKFYNLLPEELFNFSMQHGSKFDYKELKLMCYKTIEELKEFVGLSKYKFLFDEDKDIDKYMEINIQRHLFLKFRNAFKKGKIDILISIAYLHLLEYEIRDIISILEAKRYGVSSEETIEYLIMNTKGSDM